MKLSELVRSSVAFFVVAISLLQPKPPLQASIVATPGGIDTRFNLPPEIAKQRVTGFEPLPDGRVYVSIQWNIGVGEPAPGVSLVNGDGSIDTSFDFAGGFVDVDSIALQSNGKLVVAGARMQVDQGGIGLTGLARFNPNGSLDAGFAFPFAGGSKLINLSSRMIQPGAQDSIHAILADTRWARLGPDGDVQYRDAATGFIGLTTESNGGATLVNGLIKGATMVRRFADGTADATFSTEAPAGSVGAVKRLADGRYLISGPFLKQVGSVARSGLAVLRADGTLDTNFVPYKGGGVVAGSVSAVEAQPDGKVLVGGTFFIGSTFKERYLIRLMPDGALDTTFDCPLQNAQVLTLKSTGSFIYVGAQQGGFRIFSGTDAGGSVTAKPPVITQQPLPLSLPLGASGVFRVAATGSDPMVYQWYVNGVGSPLLVGRAITVAALPSTVGDYYCVVSNEGGKATSAVARLSVQVAPPTVTLPPTISFDAGSTTSFGPTVTDAQSPVTYEWFKNGVVVPAATSFSFSFPSVSAADAGTYYVVVRDQFGNVVTSNPIVVTVALPRPPRVMVEPKDVIVAADGVVTLRADFDSQPPNVTPTIQWRRNGVPIAGGQSFPNLGLWTSILNVVNASVNDSGNYDCVITSNGGTATTRLVRVVVKSGNSADALDLSFNAGTANRVGFSNPNGDGTIQAIAVQADDKIIVAGEFLTWNGLQRTNVVRLNVDGSVDVSFKAHHFTPVENGLTAVSGVAVAPNGRIYISGTWGKLDGVEDGTNGRLLRLMPDGTVDTTFQMAAGSAAADSIVVLADGTVFNNGLRLAGSVIQYMSRHPQGGAADLGYSTGYSSGRLSGANPSALAAEPDGSLFIAGFFGLRVGGGTAFNLAKLNPDGSVNATFRPVLGSSDIVEHVVRQPDGKVIATGDFRNPVNTVRRFNVDGSVDSTFNATVTGAANSRLLLDGDGSVLLPIANRTEFARLNSKGEKDSGFFARANSSIRATALDTKGRIVLAGTFTEVVASFDDAAHRYPRRFLVRLNGRNGAPVPVAQPQLGAVTFTPGGPIRFAIQTQVGTTYILETKTTLNDPTWSVAQTITGDGSEKALQAVISGVSGFYRVRLAQ